MAAMSITAGAASSTRCSCFPRLQQHNPELVVCSGRSLKIQASLRSKSVVLPRGSGFRVHAALQDAPLLEGGGPPAAQEAPESSGGAEEESRQEQEEDEIAKRTRACDKLLEVLMKERPQPDEWRKLLAFSRNWSDIRTHFFERCKERAESEEDPAKMAELYKFSRKLKEVDNELIRHEELFKKVEESLVDLDVVVANRRMDFTIDFFKYLTVLMGAYGTEPDRQLEIARIAEKILNAVEEHDKIVRDTAKFEAARQKYDDVLKTPTFADACQKIDGLVKSKQFDPALAMVATKAWASAKDSPMVKDEVKDIMFHLYKVARGNMQRQVPKEVRILKYLLSLKDPQERLAGLRDAFEPGPELEGEHIDLLYTTPTKLYDQIVTLLDAYYSNKEKLLIQEAQKLLKPAVIEKLEEVKQTMEKEFM